MPCSAAGLRQIDTAEKQHEFFAKQPRRTFAGERQAEAFIADPDLLAAISERQSMAIVAISERQSMAIVKQPRRTFAGERQDEAFIADPDLLAAISERQSMAIVAISERRSHKIAAKAFQRSSLR